MGQVWRKSSDSGYIQQGFWSFQHVDIIVERFQWRGTLMGLVWISTKFIYLLYFIFTLSNRCYNITCKGMQFQPCNLREIMRHHVMRACWWCKPLKCLHSCQLSVSRFGKTRIWSNSGTIKKQIIGSWLECSCQVMDALGKMLSTQEPRLAQGNMTLMLGNLSCTSITQW